MAIVKKSLQELHTSLRERWRPEFVAHCLLDSGIEWPKKSETALKMAAKSCREWSSMPDTFEQAVTPAGQLETGAKLFPMVTVPKTLTPVTVTNYLHECNAILGRHEGDDFKARPLQKFRTKDGILPKDWVSHRPFNKRWRFLVRLETKLTQYQKHGRLCELAQVAKSRLAFQISLDEFMKDPKTAGFLAYYVATLNRRSTFTAGKQARAFDTVAQALFDGLDATTANWWAITHVHVDALTMVHLSDARKGGLLGKWYALMQEAALILKDQVKTQEIDLKRLVVKRGNDSSTWNAAAGAYNKAREGWINCLYAMGAADLLVKMTPPKALRLMAADVVYMHSRMGSGDVEPNTKVWQKLPKPWEVMLDHVTCTREMVETACLESGVPDGSWVQPAPKQAVAFVPTPELVHGVMIESPQLASAFKKAGFFAGPSKAKVQSPSEELDA